MNMSQTVTVRSGAWHGDVERPLPFPDHWRVQVYAPSDAPALGSDQLNAALDAPIGTSSLEELAHGKNSAAIVVDDLCRPTPISPILPGLLDRLQSGGIAKQNIRFVIGSGSHRLLTQEEMVKKLGAAATAYEVQNHDFMSGDLRALGNLSCGMPLYINPTVADADLKVCVGSISPHGLAGFSGGAKLVVPGVAGYATIHYLHNMCSYRGRGSKQSSISSEDGREAMEEAARRLGLDFIVNVVINTKREVAGVFAGDFSEAHQRGMELASDTYATSLPAGNDGSVDLVVANAYPYDADPVQLGKSLWVSEYFADTYTLVFNPACDGICYHGARVGLDYAHFKAQETQFDSSSVEVRVGRRHQRIVCSENFPARHFYKRFASDILVRDWEGILERLDRELPAAPNVALLPCAPIQIPAPSD